MTAEPQTGKKKDAPEFMFSSVLMKEVIAMLGGHQLFVLFFFFFSPKACFSAPIFQLLSLKSHGEVPFLMLTFFKVTAALNLQWLVSCEAKCRPFPPSLCFKELSKPGLFSKRFSPQAAF